jgi:hypothetical protein
MLSEIDKSLATTFGDAATKKSEVQTILLFPYRRKVKRKVSFSKPGYFS